MGYFGFDCKMWLITSFLILLFGQKVKTDVVYLHFATLNVDGSFKFEGINGISKEINRNDIATIFKIFDARSFDACATDENYELFIDVKTVVFIHLNSPSCSMQTIMNNLERNKVSLALFSLNGTINTSFSNISIATIFIPYELADKINPLSEKAYVEVFHTKDCFDYSSIVLYLIVFLVLLLGTLWSGRKFKLILKSISFDFPDQKSFEDSKRSLELEYFFGQLIILFIPTTLILLDFRSFTITWVYIVVGALFVISVYRITNLIISQRQWLFIERITFNNFGYHPFSKLSAVPTILSTIAAGFLLHIYYYQTWSWLIQDLIILTVIFNILSMYRFQSYSEVFMLMSSMHSWYKSTNAERNDYFPNDLNFESFLKEDFRFPFHVIIPYFSNSAHFLSYPYAKMDSLEILTLGFGLNYALEYDLAQKHKFKYYFIASLVGFSLSSVISLVAYKVYYFKIPLYLSVIIIQLIVFDTISFLRNEFVEFYFGTEMRASHLLEKKTENRVNFIQESLNRLRNNMERLQITRNRVSALSQG